MPHSTTFRGLFVPEVPVNILGLSFQLPQPYSAGHTCSAAEADALNKVLVRGLSKGLYKVLKRALERLGYSSGSSLTSDEKPDVLAQGQEYIEDFAVSFSVGHDEARAVRTESLRIARALVETKLNATGQRTSDLNVQDYEAQVQKLAASERVQSEAQRRVKVTQEIANRAHDELLEALGENGT